MIVKFVHERKALNVRHDFDVKRCFRCWELESRDELVKMMEHDAD